MPPAGVEWVETIVEASEIDRLTRQPSGANQSEDSVALASRAYHSLGGAHRGH